MTDIQRWSHEHPTECVQVRYEHGSWVRYEDHAAAIAAAYTLMGAAIQNGIDAERKRIRFAFAALVDGDVIDLSLPEYRAVLEAIDEEPTS